MINPAKETDFETIFEIINDAAQAYKGVIPADRWKEPYMPREELRHEMDSGVRFWLFEDEGHVKAVMGVQDVEDVTLIRHAYVRTAFRNKGIGGKLLKFLEQQIKNPILIGTWKDAFWAVSFYRKHGFVLVDKEEKNRLLKSYWDIPERQVETSVVLRKE